MCPLVRAHRRNLVYTIELGFLRPTRVHNPNGISIGSAVFSQFTSESRGACRGMLFLFKIAPSHAESVHGFLGPPESASQTASRSVQPFLYNSLQKVPKLYIGRPFSQKLPLPMRDLDPI